MLTVYIWSFRGKSEAWGHASMSVDRTYISWWPEAPGQVTSRIRPNIYKSNPFRTRTYQDDVRAEGQSADHLIHLDGLDEKSIKDWWHSLGLNRDGTLFQGPLLSWNTLKRNCSNVVAEGLRMGGGDTQDGVNPGTSYGPLRTSWRMQHRYKRG